MWLMNRLPLQAREMMGDMAPCQVVWDYQQSLPPTHYLGRAAGLVKHYKSRHSVLLYLLWSVEHTSANFLL